VPVSRPRLTTAPINELDATVDWVSLNNVEITINSNLPL
jgi:hypothetical protein